MSTHSTSIRRTLDLERPDDPFRSAAASPEGPSAPSPVFPEGSEPSRCASWRLSGDVIDVVLRPRSRSRPPTSSATRESSIASSAASRNDLAAAISSRAAACRCSVPSETRRLDRGPSSAPTSSTSYSDHQVVRSHRGHRSIMAQVRHRWERSPVVGRAAHTALCTELDAELLAGNLGTCHMTTTQRRRQCEIAPVRAHGNG